MTTETQKSQRVGVAPEATSPRPTRRQAIDAAVRAGIKRRSATQVYDWLRDTVLPECREGDGSYFVTSEELTGKRYLAFEAIFPHGSISGTPGSPQAAFTDSLLRAADGEYALAHDMDPDKGLQYCSVSIHRSAV